MYISLEFLNKGQRQVIISIYSIDDSSPVSVLILKAFCLECHGFTFDLVGLMTVVTSSTDRPKTVLNGCVIERY